jgi:hypothetical protein
VVPPDVLAWRTTMTERMIEGTPTAAA